MSRYNIFNQAHQSLRALLYDTAMLVQQTQFLDNSEAATALARVKRVAEKFKAQAAHETASVLPAIQQYEPSIADLFALEREKGSILCEGLLGLIIVYRHAIKEEVKVDTGQAIHQALTGFLVFQLEHMTKKETILNKILWRYFSDEELLAMSESREELVSSL